MTVPTPFSTLTLKVHRHFTTYQCRVQQWPWSPQQWWRHAQIWILELSFHEETWSLDHSHCLRCWLRNQRAVWGIFRANHTWHFQNVFMQILIGSRVWEDFTISETKFVQLNWFLRILLKSTVKKYIQYHVNLRIRWCICFWLALK